MSTVTTLTFTSDSMSAGTHNDIFVNTNKRLALSNIENYISAILSGSTAAVLTAAVNGGNAVAASGTLTCASVAVGDTAVVDAVTLTAANAFEKVTVTAPSTAGATQADYFVLSNTAGAKAAFWLDINANGTEPTGAAYVAADSKIKVSIVTGGTAAQNGTILKLAAATILGYVATDNGDGTVSYVQTVSGNCTNAARHNAGDSGNGSFSFSGQIDGSVIGATGFDIGASNTQCAANLAAAINAQATLSPFLIATSALGVVTVTCLVRGIIGNTITLAATGNVTAGAAKLAGGAENSSASTYSFL